jgi:transcription initiation factor TFIIIB Brf1 subunit/transcription initiation factor TFIIB
MPYKERSLNKVFIYIKEVCKKAKILDCVIDDAKILYKNINDCVHDNGKKRGQKVIKRGNNRQGIIASCVYFACKKNKHVRTEKEIAKMFGLKSITKGCKQFSKLLLTRKMKYECEISSPEQYIQRFGNKLKINKDYIKIATDIANNIKKLNIITNHTPISVAAGTTLLMANKYELNINTKIVATEYNISEVTVTKVFRELEKYSKVILDNKKTEEALKLLNKK